MAKLNKIVLAYYSEVKSTQIEFMITKNSIFLYLSVPKIGFLHIFYKKIAKFGSGSNPGLDLNYSGLLFLELPVSFWFSSNPGSIAS